MTGSWKIGGEAHHIRLHVPNTIVEGVQKRLTSDATAAGKAVTVPGGLYWQSAGQIACTCARLHSGERKEQSGVTVTIGRWKKTPPSWENGKSGEQPVI